MTQALKYPDLNYTEYHWSIEQYHQMIKTGILKEDDRVELLIGKIVNMSPIGKMHAACVTRLNEYFYARFIGKYTLRSENPISLLNNSEPEPDYIIAVRKDDNYLSSHPGADDIFLVIEVADNSLEWDRKNKLFIYASSGIREYWIINLVDRQIEQFTEPDIEKGIYTLGSIHSYDAVFSSGILDGIKVADLFP